MTFEIKSRHDAYDAKSIWIDPLDASRKSKKAISEGSKAKPDNISNELSLYVQIFEAKYQQLITLSRKSISESNLCILPDSEFFRSYIVRGKRQMFSPTIHNVSFEIIYNQKKAGVKEGDKVELNDLEEKRVSTSKTFYITPNSFVLSALAALFSVFGVVLQHVIENDSQFNTFLQYYESLLVYMTNGEAIKAAIIAIIFFNLYEQSPFSKKISFGSNWRTAFLVGIMSGMFGDRLIEALKIKIGL